MSGVVDQSRWGVCGFVCVMNALHEQGKLAEFGQGLTISQIHQRLGAEVITYLKMTNIERPQLADEILQFTKTFGPPYDGYQSIDDMCRRIATEVTAGRVIGVNAQPEIAVAMPAHAVQDYLRFVGLRSKLTSVWRPALTRKELLRHRDCIVGLGKNPSTVEANRLRHWVYVDPQGILLNWGTSTDLRTTDVPKNLTSVLHYLSWVVQLK